MQREHATLIATSTDTSSISTSDYNCITYVPCWNKHYIADFLFWKNFCKKTYFTTYVQPNRIFIIGFLCFSESSFIKSPHRKINVWWPSRFCLFSSVSVFGFSCESISKHYRFYLVRQIDTFLDESWLVLLKNALLNTRIVLLKTVKLKRAALKLDYGHDILEWVKAVSRMLYSLILHAFSSTHVWGFQPRKQIR